VITSTVDDGKATFYIAQCTVVANGVESTKKNCFRYSQLLDFNEGLMKDYGAIRILRLFPPKKWVGNHDGNFVQQRLEAIQLWMSELIEDEELCDDQKVRTFFGLTKPE
jgi:hypothetical protein